MDTTRVFGHGIDDKERYCARTKHMIVFAVDCGKPILSFWNKGLLGGTSYRLFVPEGIYRQALKAQDGGSIKIISHAYVENGRLVEEVHDYP
ncbi:hypothetical protein FACS1894208_09430 [Clostridia bacterium]|nr:hypothetical protein FACS1894208_09430 [Clostridia bacterium]